MARKTVPVADVVAKINRTIKYADNQEVRIALSIIVEDILFDTGNYKGFIYNGGYNVFDPNFDEYNRRYLIDLKL